MSDPFAILTTDLHLTEKIEDQYRFGIFNWIIDRWGGLKYTDAVFITGDLTDRKDNHSGWFVNKIVDHLNLLAKYFDVYLLKGNHDFVDPTSPFFRFVNGMSNIQYFIEPKKLKVIYPSCSANILMLPHTKSPDRDWAKLEFVNTDVVFLHQTFRGARAESGIELDGLSTARFNGYKAKFYSGDIHVPQKVGPVIYTGAPYHIHFGDQFRPRVLLLDKHFGYTEAHFPAPRKYTVEIKAPSELKKARDLKDGDWIKVRLTLPRADFPDWPKHRDEIRRLCDKLHLKLHGVELRELSDLSSDREGKKKTQNRPRNRDPLAVFQMYCKARSIDENTAEVGLELLKIGEEK